MKSSKLLQNLFYPQSAIDQGGTPKPNSKHAKAISSFKIKKPDMTKLNNPKVQYSNARLHINVAASSSPR
jgi:hypothetical protein